MSEAGPGRHIPEFAVTLRGYDRGQVEEYVSALQTFLAEAQRRAAAAEAELAEVRAARSVGGNVGGRAKEALRLDEPASAPERVSGVDLSDPLLGGLPDRVGASVARIFAEAQQAARVLLDEAQTQPARQVAAAQSRLRQLSEQADREQARRDQVRRHSRVAGRARRHHTPGLNSSWAAPAASTASTRPHRDKVGLSTAPLKARSRPARRNRSVTLARSWRPYGWDRLRAASAWRLGRRSLSGSNSSRRAAG